jgi:hypothetical protein
MNITLRKLEHVQIQDDSAPSHPFRLSISPNMKKPDVTCSARTNDLLWPAPKLSRSAAYGRLWQAKAGYGRRINIFLHDAPGFNSAYLAYSAV